LVEYTTSGTVVQTIALPTIPASSGNRALTISSEGFSGQLHLSMDGKYLACAGYNAAPGTGGIAATSNNGGGGDVDRVVGRIDWNGNIDTSTSLNGTGVGGNVEIYSGFSIRQAIFAGSGIYHCGGSRPGLGYTAALGNTTSAVVYNSASAIRAITIGAGDLYQMEGTTLKKYAGLPTSSTIPTTLITYAPGNQTGVAVVDTSGGSMINVIYIQAASSLLKYALVAGTWTAKGSVTTTSSGMITAKVSGGNVNLFISSPSKIQTLTDTTGTGDFTGTPVTTIVSSAPANTSFRGVAFTPATYTVTYNANSATSGTEPTDSTVYGQFETATPAANSGSLARTGYTFAGWNTAANGSGTSYTPGSGSIPMSGGDVTLYAKWTATVTYDANGGDTAPSDGTAYAQYQFATVSGVGSMTRSGYSFNGWNTAADGTGTDYAPASSISMSDGNVTLYAKWTTETLPTYTITPSAGTGGTISPGSETNVTQGNSLTFTITPDSGYIINEVLVDGINNPLAATSGSYTFVNVTTTHTIAATFTQIFEIAASAGAGGGISPSGTTNVVIGSDITFTITTNPGYLIDQVLVDGVNNPAAVASGSYTFDNVTASHSIAASFVAIHTITASAGTGGSISPSGTITVTNGNDQTYTITADAGYSVYNVVVDGVAQGGITTYSFSSVASNHTILALFVAPAASPAEGTISVNYYMPSSSSQAMAATNSVGAIPATNWNNISFAGLGSFAAPIQVFKDNSGLPVGPFNALLSNNGNNTFNSNSTNRNVDMLSTWALNGGGTVTFTNIPYTNSYNLYVYFSGFLGSVGSNVVRYTIGTVTNTLWQTNTPAEVATFGFSQNNNYVVFSNLTGSVQSMSVVYVGGNNASGVAGFQIEAAAGCVFPAQAPAGPDPSLNHTNTVMLAGSFSGSASSAYWSGGGGSFSPDTNTLNASYTPSMPEKIAGTVTLSLTTDDPGAPCGAASDSITITLTNTIPVANATTCEVAPGESITIPVSSGDQSLAIDPDGDPLVVSLGDTNALEFGTASVTGSSDGITYTDTNGSAGSETLFNYIVSDGYGGFATNSITIRMSPAMGVISATGDDTFAYLTYAGIAGTNYALDWATNLTSPINWTEVQTKVAPSNGFIRFTNQMSLYPTNDFFRIRYVP
ncbi:MAG: beta strand repeat-containing protein, partial [Verrucomicrobiota bacterium]